MRARAPPAAKCVPLLAAFRHGAPLRARLQPASGAALPPVPLLASLWLIGPPLPCPLAPGKPFDPEGVAEAVEHVRSLIAEEVAAGVPPSRIVVGGFSQVGGRAGGLGLVGGAVGLFT